MNDCQPTVGRNPPMKQQAQAEVFLSCTALFWHSRDQAQQWSHCAKAQDVPSSGGIAKPEQPVGSPSGRINPEFLLVNCQAISASHCLYCSAAGAERVVGLDLESNRMCVNGIDGCDPRNTGSERTKPVGAVIC